jgi:hypothetical protein
MEKIALGAAAADSASPPGLTATSVESLIERWWADHFPGSPVAQVTQAWNHAFAAKEELKRRLEKFTSETARNRTAA